MIATLLCDIDGAGIIAATMPTTHRGFYSIVRCPPGVLQLSVDLSGNAWTRVTHPIFFQFADSNRVEPIMRRPRFDYHLGWNFTLTPELNHNT